MQPTDYIAIGALVVSLGSLLVSVVIAIKTFSKSKRDAYIHRRDHLFQATSELNARNTEAHLISARFEIVAVKRAGLPVHGKQAEDNASQIASINRLRDALETSVQIWTENIDVVHGLCRDRASEAPAAMVERLIDLVRVASDKLKESNDGCLATLHILEATNQMLETSLALAASQEMARRVALEFEQGMKSLGLGAEPAPDL